ncbi:Protein of unknown function, partial [Cotesia congregata]
NLKKNENYLLGIFVGTQTSVNNTCSWIFTAFACFKKGPEVSKNKNSTPAVLGLEPGGCKHSTRPVYILKINTIAFALKKSYQGLFFPGFRHVEVELVSRSFELDFPDVCHQLRVVHRDTSEAAASLQINSKAIAEEKAARNAKQGATLRIQLFFCVLPRDIEVIGNGAVFPATEGITGPNPAILKDLLPTSFEFLPDNIPASTALYSATRVSFDKKLLLMKIKFERTQIVKKNTDCKTMQDRTTSTGQHLEHGTHAA